MRSSQNNTAKNFASKSIQRYLATTALTITGLLALATPASADNWTDLENIGGSFTTDTSTPNLTTITQTSQIAKARGDLDINENHTVNIKQNNSSSLFAAYDIEGDPTQILGRLSANGRVLVIDQNGVFFGPNSTVDVGSLIVTTGNIAPNDIDSGKFDVNLSDASGSIENHGSITVADAGLAAFVAPTVINSGVINAKLGTVALASGQKVTVDLYGDNLVELAVGDKLSNALIKNSGKIRAEGGKVVITADAAKDVVDNVINMDGVIDVSSVSVQGGKIVLNGGSKGTVKVSGKVNASGTKAGSVAVKGENLDVSGDINADGGNGNVTLWGEEATMFTGKISALGDNSSVETSGGKLGVHGDVILSDGGEWLLDPTDLWVVGGNGDGGPAVSGGVFSPDDTPAIPPSGDSFYWVGVNFINNALNNGNNVTLRTHNNGVREGDIQVNADILKTAGGNATLTLQAHDDIDLNKSISSTVGNLNVVLTADYDHSGGSSDVNLNSGADVLTNGGNFTINAPGNVTLSAGSVIDVKGGSAIIAPKGIFSSVDANSVRASGLGTIRIFQNAGGLIQNAINAIQNTGTGLSMVDVGSGTYNESVLINKSLRLQGANWGVAGDNAGRVAETIIIPGAGNNGVTVAADNVIVDGFTISDAKDGVHVNGFVSNAKILNNIIDGSTQNGVALSDSQNAQVNKNLITNTAEIGIRSDFGSNFVAGSNVIDGTGDRGISVGVTNGIKLLDNKIDNTGNDAISSHNSTGAITISGNQIGQKEGSVINGNGIMFMNATGGSIKGNTISNLSSLSGDHSSGIYLYNSSNVKVGGAGTSDRNTITNAGWDGIKIWRGSNNTAENNSVSGADRVGIYSEASDSVKIMNNVIAHTDSTIGSLSGGIGLLDGTNAQIIGNDVSDASYGIHVKDADGTIKIIGNKVHDTSLDGIYAEATTGLKIDTNTINDTDGDAIHLDEGTSFTTINGNQIGQTASIGGDGIYVLKAVGGKIQSNVISNTGLSGENDNGSGIYIDQTQNILIGGAGEGEGNTISDVKWDNIKVLRGSGATVQGNDVSHAVRVGIYSESSSDLKIIDNKINDANNTSFGALGINFGNNVLISGNDITGNETSKANAGIFAQYVSGKLEILGNTIHDIAMGEGIHEFASPNVTINDNTITKVEGNGIYVEEFELASLSGNDITNSGDNGIDVYDGETAIISGGTIINSGYNGIRVGGDADGASVDNVSISDAEVTLSGYDGIHVHYFGTANIQGNTVSKSGDDGIEAHDGFSVTVADNDVSESGYGVIVEGPGETYDGYDEFNGGSDGISVRNIYGYYGKTEEPGEVRITGNTVTTSGDDGVEVVNVNGTVYIASNTITDSGVGEGGTVDYADADEYGADGIHVRNVFNDSYDNSLNYQLGDFGNGEYNIVVADNTVDLSADDGVEIIGSGYDSGSGPIILTKSKVSYDDDFGYGETGRVLVQNNTISNSGYGYGGSFGGTDGNGGDGIHVAGIFGDGYYASAGESSDETFSGYAVDIIGNDVSNSGDDGIEVVDATSVLIDDNTVTNSGFVVDSEDGSFDTGDFYGADGIHVRNVWNESYVYAKAFDDSGIVPYSVVIRNNTDVSNSLDDGIQVLFSGDTLIAGNTVTNSGQGPSDRAFGGDGINVVTGTSYSSPFDLFFFAFSDYIEPVRVEVSGNNVDNSFDDGIEIVGANNVLVDLNTVTNSGDDGINILGFAGYGDAEGGPEEASKISLLDVIDWPYFYSQVTNNTVVNSGNDGIEISGFDEIHANTNSVANSGANGLYISGFNNGYVDVSGNGFTNNDIGAQFESGLIDLTGNSNSFTGGRVGLRFAPYAFGDGSSDGEGDVALLASSSDQYGFYPYPFNVPTSGFAPLSLVDDDAPDAAIDFGGTIGNQIFADQTQYYVELANGAFFAPGTPTLLNGLNSSYDGLRPTDFADLIIPQADYDDLEQRFYHFVDTGTEGLFFFGTRQADPVAAIDQSDIFNQFSNFDGNPSGLSVRIIGLPRIPGAGGGTTGGLNNIQTFAGGGNNTPGGLNNIETAAGGDNQTSGNTNNNVENPQDLSNIETQAGGDNTSCWSDAATIAGNGQAVNVVYGGSMDDTLNQAAACGGAL